MDETSFSLNYPIRACWMRRGQQRALPAFSGKREYLHVMGGYNWRTDQVTALTVERKNSETFIAFLERLLVATYSNDPVVLVMDNASYHYSANVQAALSLFEHRVAVIWLPQYCPELNVIERFWLHLKNLASANRLYDRVEALHTSVLAALAMQNDPQSVDRLTFSKYFR